MAFESATERSSGLQLDVLAAVAGLVLALALFPLRFIASQIYIETIPIVLGGACGLYLLSVYRDRRSTGLGTRRSTALPTLGSATTMALPSVVVVGLAAMVLSTAIHGERTIGYFVLASIVATFVFVQILFTSDRDFHRGLLLFQIVLFAAVFRFTALYATPGLIGVDAWTHITQLANGIYVEESLGAIASDKHFAAPFYHLLVVGAALLYDVSLRGALYLSLGVVMPLSILLVYAATNLLVPDRWAVLAAALYATAGYVTHWGMHLIPTSLGIVFFLAVVYALTRVMRIEYALRDFTLLVLLSVAVILTHQVSTFIMLVLLGSAFLAQLVFMLGLFGHDRLDTSVFRTKKPANLVGLVVFDFGLTIFVWSLTPFRQQSFLATVLSWLQETLADSAGFMNLARPTESGDGGGGAATGGPTLLAQVVEYVDVLGFLLLLGATFAGCLYVVHRRRSEQSVFTFLIATALMLVFVLGLPMFGVRNFIPTRWFGFLYAPMAIIAAIGLRHLATNLGTRTVVACMLLVALVYPGAMILAAPSSADNPVFPNQHERIAYDETELAAVASIRELTGGPSASDIRPDQVLFTDHPYQTVLQRTHAHYAEPATIVDGEPVEHQVTVYRSAQSTDTTYFRNADGHGQSMNVPEERLCRPTQATLYTNGDVTMCTASPATL